MKAKLKRKPPINLTELELKRWCIEQANNWKWDSGSYSNGMGINKSSSEPNIIARAEQIYNWVKK